MNIPPNRWLTPSSYILIILAMFLPFCHFKCGGMKVASVKGVDMVIKGKAKPSSTLEGMGNAFSSGKKKNALSGSEDLGVKINIWVVLTVVAAFAGLAVYFLRIRPNHKILFFISLAGILFLLAFVITRNQFFGLNELLGDGDKEDREFRGSGIISIGLGIGFWLCMLGFAASAAYNFKDRSPQPLPIDEIGSDAHFPPPVV